MYDALDMKKFIVVIIISFCLFGTASAREEINKKIENLTPGEWYQIPKSQLIKSGVIPDPRPPGNGGVHSVMGAWCGGAYDTKRDRLLIWGGGHTDYSGNEIYAFDVNSLKWERIWGPTPNEMIPLEYKAYQTYLDGNPSARHTFGGLQYIPGLDVLWSHGSSVWKSSNGKQLPYIASWQFQLDNERWEMKGHLPNVHGSRVSAFDPVTGHIFSRSVTGIHEYDPVAGTWVERFKYTAGWWFLANAAIDPERRIMIMMGQGTLEIFNLKTNRLKRYKIKELSGGTEIVKAKAPGLEYVPRLKAFVCWTAEQSKGIAPGVVYVIDPDTMYIQTRFPQQKASQNIPQKSAMHGTYGRFRYIPSKDVFIVANSVYDSVYIYQLSEKSSPSADFYGTKQMGELTIRPTRFSIGIEWPFDNKYVSEDVNHNAVVKVRYRKADQQTHWLDALNLMRVHDFNLNMMAGSIFFLTPDTSYEVELEFSDPDGGRWVEKRDIRTLNVPEYPKKGRHLYVVPGESGGDGSQANPFQGLGSAIHSARPGDTFLIHSGRYTGTHHFKTDGKKDAYIVWKGQPGDPPIFENKIFVSGSFNWFEGIHFDISQDCKGIQALGDKFSNSPEGVVITGNRFSGGEGCKTIFHMIHGVPHARNWYITDNTIKGPIKLGTKTFSGEGIDMGYHTPYPTGHTIAYNSISNVADGISYPGGNCDIFGNDIFNVVDDGIEADYGSANVRIYKNRITMAQNNAISLQDFDNGMPWYIIRNQIVGFGENVLKIRQHGIRFAFYHNTVVNWKGMFKYQPELAIYGHMKNNVMAAVNGGRMWDFKSSSPTWKTDSDYNAFDWGGAKQPFSIFGKNYSRLVDFSSCSGLDRHSFAFNKSICLTAIGLKGPLPTEIKRTFIELKKGCRAIDRGVNLPNINQYYSGKAPDNGAYEVGEPLPHYGPRIQKAKSAFHESN